MSYILLFYLCKYLIMQLVEIWVNDSWCPFMQMKPVSPHSSRVKIAFNIGTGGGVGAGS